MQVIYVKLTLPGMCNVLQPGSATTLRCNLGVYPLTITAYRNTSTEVSLLCSKFYRQMAVIWILCYARTLSTDMETCVDNARNVQHSELHPGTPPALVSH